MNWWLVLAGFTIHLFFFYSIFEIYFTSPLVHGMTPHDIPLKPPAKRVVFFSTDGLRADKLFGLDANGETRAPFLRNIIEKEGAWGISHTRVPTESRPGHVALIAGFYEDVSAVAKGWKENPVEFDSVFNESRYTWSWGSPDILPMFAKGASGSHVYTHTYPAESEDFAGADSSRLDTWVFDRVSDFLRDSKQNGTLVRMLHEDKVVLFLHLLGLDTNGHAHKPYSDEYAENIRVVDRGIQATVALLEDFYSSDGQTAYVLSSDHGMTNWGSHGAGLPSETLTPLIAWGAGIRKPLPAPEELVHTDGYEQEWKLSEVKRSDVNQADISPLLSSLIGVPFPLNNVGTLPLDYLDNTPHFKAESIFANALEFLEQFEVKMRHKQATTLSAFFTPFRLLTPSLQAARVRDIRNLIQRLDYDEAIEQSLELMELSLKGLRYYHNYDRFFLGTSIALGFLGWMTYIFSVLLEKHTSIVQPRVRMDILHRTFWCSEKGIRLLFIIFGIIVAVLLYVQSLPWTNYVYCLIPVILWHKVVQRWYTFQDLWWYTLDHGYFTRAIFLVVSGIFGLEIMVLSFFYRGLLSLGLMTCATWPFITHLSELSKTVTVGWVTSCLLLAVFPMLPVVGDDTNYVLVYLAGLVALGLAFSASFRFEANIFVTKRGKEAPPPQVKLLTSGQMAVVVAATLIVWSTSNSIQSKQGLPLLNQILSWTILGLSFVLPMFSSSRMLTRLVNIGLSFLPPYLLMSTAHEALYCLVLCIMLFFWLQAENKLLDTRIHRLEDLDFSGHGLRLTDRHRKLVIQDARNAFFFIFLLLTAFFGTGNIASINSFDPASVYCFLTVFSPFTMGALMLWKILIPFLLVTCTFNAIHLCVNVPTQSLFLLVLLISDFMGLHFFFLVKEEGSWLDIGTSISHYVIVMTLILFLSVLLALGKFFTQVTFCKGKADKKHS